MARPLRVAREEPQQIECVGAQDHQVFAARAPVFLAARPNLHDISDRSLAQQGIGALGDTGNSSRVSDLDFHAPILGRFHHRVGVAQGGCERFFHQDVSAGARRGEKHGTALIEPPGADGDDIRLLAIDHLMVIGVSPIGPAASHGALPARFIRVCDRYYLGLGYRVPGHVPIVSVISAAGPPIRTTRYSRRDDCAFSRPAAAAPINMARLEDLIWRLAPSAA